MARKGYEELEVYRKSYALALQVHRLSLTFPEWERYELGRQLREATKSIPANIAEGYGRKGSRAEFRRFLTIALGSCDEVQVGLSFAKDLGYLPPEPSGVLQGGYQEIGRMLTGLARAWAP